MGALMYVGGEGGGLNRVRARVGLAAPADKCRKPR